MEYFNRFLQTCTVSVLDAQKTVCWKNWQEWNYTPTYNKFYFILSGYGELIVDGVSYFPKAGDLFLMPAGVVQSYHLMNGSDCSVFSSKFTKSP